MSLAARLVLESLRLDLDPEEAVRERAETALALGVGGFIVFGGERRQVARLVRDLRDRAGRDLWIGADLERGPGQQFAGLPTLPPPAGLAAHPDPEEAARQAGEITARGARSVGVDLVFAPVLDLDIEPENPIVGTRSFGADPVAVARLAGTWIEGCQEQGVIACGKHFPGHGRTTADSHEEIPSVDVPARELDADLLPFRRLAGPLGAILTAHVAYPTLEVEAPATLSRKLLTGLLREKLGFDGLIVTDAMNMSGFIDAGGVGHPPAVRALLAGCDLLLYPEDLAATVDDLERAAREDERVAERIEEALERGRRTRRRFTGLTERALRRGRKLARELGREIKRELRELGLGEDAADTGLWLDPDEREQDGRDGGLPDPDVLQSAAIGLLSVQRVGGLPEWMRAGRPIRVIGVWDDREDRRRPRFGGRFVDELLGAGWQAALAESEDQPERIPSIVLVASTPQAWKGAAGLTPNGAARVRHALSNPSGAYPVVFGHRRLLDELADAGICAWSTEPILELLAARRLVSDASASSA
ncbi:MAG: glycoside hydrolase family 3 N-terminal domain-containing protein [Gemmatimonadota bacterium]